MRRIGVRNRVGVMVLAALIAMLGVSTGWSVTSVSAQDDEVAAAAITPGSDAVVADGPLNQRSTAGTGGAILQVLSTGTLVSVISGPTAANGYSWWNVDANGINGYVAGEFLAEVGFVVGDNVMVIDNNVNVRSGAGTNNPAIDQLNSGTIAEIIGGPVTATGYTWYQIQYETSMTGWIAGIFLELSSSPPPSAEFGVDSWILVNDPPVNLRAGAGTSFAILATLEANQAVMVTGVPIAAGGYTWYPVVTIGSASGYVAGSYFEGGLYLADYGTVADGPLNLRAAASNSGAILTTMPTNASIFINDVTPVYANGHTWFNVTYNGSTGWASGSYLAPA